MKQQSDMGGNEIVNSISINTSNLMSFLSNSTYLPIPTRPNISILFQLLDVLKFILFLFLSTLILNVQ